MAYLTVDKDGTEWVWNCCPLRNKYRGGWESLYSEDGEYHSVELPKGSIEKLIGWSLTWENEPYDYDSTNMTQEELHNLYNKVSDVLYGFKSYHCWYCCSNETYYDNSMDFEVHVHSDKDEGDDWVEYWSIDDEGKIYSEDTTYDSFEEFLREWE